MKHLYLLTLEVAPLEADGVYDKLPSHLTLMSRFLSNLSPESLANAVRSLFASTVPVSLAFGETVRLGPNKVVAHMVTSPDELKLHYALRKVLDTTEITYEYPEFVGDNHKPHVTERVGVHYESGDQYVASVAYLIEVVDKKRVVRAKFILSGA